jgi:hypothetical protein
MDTRRRLPQQAGIDMGRQRNSRRPNVTCALLEPNRQGLDRGGGARA